MRKERSAWNKGRLLGQKPPLKPKEIWSLRIRLQLATQEMVLGNVILKAERVEQLLLRPALASHHREHPRRDCAQLQAGRASFSTQSAKSGPIGTRAMLLPSSTPYRLESCRPHGRRTTRLGAHILAPLLTRVNASLAWVRTCPLRHVGSIGAALAAIGPEASLFAGPPRLPKHSEAGREGAGRQH